MGLKEQITTDRENIISMIASGQDYGYNNQIMAHFFWSLLGERLTDEEIEEYARSVEFEPEYGEEDYEEITERLQDWRSRQNK